MDVRIGVTQTPSEIEVELGDDTDGDKLVKDVESALAKTSSVLWLTDRKGRRVGVPAEKIAYVEIGTPEDDRRVGFGVRSVATQTQWVRRSCSTASSSSSPARAASARRTIAASLALLGAEQGKRTLVCEVDAKGNLADFFETGPDRLRRRARSSPGLFAMSMDTEESLKEYLSLQLKLPLVARVGPLARMFDFVATAAPGRQGDPHRRQARLGGAGAPLRPGRGRRLGHRPHRRPAGRPAGHQRAGAGRAWCASRPAGCSTSSATRRRPAWSSCRRPRRCR